MYVDIGFKERIAAVPWMIYFAIWEKKEDNQFDNFII